MVTDTPGDTSVTIYEYVGGEEAFLALATALNELCLADPVLNHPFSHPSHPQHLERLGWYLGEVFGGPARYSDLGESHRSMVELHASNGADDDYADHFLSCFDRAVEDAGFPANADLRRALHDYMVWATRDVEHYFPLGSIVPPVLDFPHWSWDGPVA